MDSQTLARRQTYPSYALLWFSPFARDLVAGREGQAADFFTHHLACDGGLRMYPLWDTSFNGDGNQMGQHYPVGSDATFVKLLSQTQQPAPQQRWLNWLEQFWSTHTLPEGVTLEAENDGACRPDNPGCNQAFTTKVWYWSLLHGIAGISFDAGGLTMDAGSAWELGVEGLYYRDKRWSISMEGCGPFVQRLEIDGREVLGTCKVPEDALTMNSHAGEIMVRVWRGPLQNQWPQLLSADHATLSGVVAISDRLTMQLHCPCRTRIRFSSTTRPTLTWQGQSVDYHYDEQQQTGHMDLETVAGLQGELCITCAEGSPRRQVRSQIEYEDG